MPANGFGQLTDWFTERFPARYHRKRLFDEQPDALRHVGPFDQGQRAPAVSSPERALLELLSDVGVRQPMQEARELAEGTPIWGTTCCANCCSTAPA